MDLGWLAEAGQLFQKRDEWIHTLSATDMAAIHLARAFIMNPEVLVLNRPTVHFDPGRSSKIYGLIHEFVDQRGVEVGGSEEAAARRRPRTCFMSTGEPSEC